MFAPVATSETYTNFRSPRCLQQQETTMISSTQIQTLDMSSFSHDFSEVPDPTFLLLDPVEITFPPFDRTAHLRGDKRSAPTSLSVDKYVSQDCCGPRPNISQFAKLPSCQAVMEFLGQFLGVNGVVTCHAFQDIAAQSLTIFHSSCTRIFRLWRLKHTSWFGAWSWTWSQ